MLLLSRDYFCGLEKYFNNSLCFGFKVLVYSGAGLYDSVHRAVNIIRSEKWTQIYFLAGLCSLTYKDPKLRNVSIRTTATGISLERFRMELNQSLEFVSRIVGESNTNVKYVLTPITGIDLSLYNKGQTVGLAEVQQPILNNLIIETNKLIVQVNTVNDVNTPWVSRLIHKRNRDKICHLYHRLASDGCHLTDELRRAWADILSDAVLKNSEKAV